MIPILFEKDEKVFATNGLGRLRDCTRCECSEERNGVYEVEFDYPTDGAHFDELLCGRIIGVEHDDTQDMQPFEIYAYSKPIDGVVTFKAFHISYKLGKMTVLNGGPINSLSAAFTLLKNNATPSNPFTFWTDIESTNYMSGAEGAPKTVRQLLGGVEGSVLDAYGGEYEWDRWTVKLWSERGKIRDYTIRYGFNMVDYQEDTDYSETFNAIIPYWQGQDDYGNEVIVRGGVISSGTTYDNETACVPVDLTDKFEDQPTVSALETMAQSYMSANQPTLPSQNIKVDFIRLQDSEEFKTYAQLQNCNLCDSVHVVFPRYGMDGYFKIVKVVYDVLLERYISMELGTLSRSLADVTGGSGGGSSLANQPTGIIESGTDGIWTWRKWADGTAECWGVTAFENYACTTAYGSLYYAPLKSFNFPSGLFTARPELNLTPHCANGCVVGINSLAAGYFSFYAYSPRNATQNISFNVYALGKWK